MVRRSFYDRDNELAEEQKKLLPKPPPLTPKVTPQRSSFSKREILADAISLFPYQVEGAKWLCQNPFRYLADEMGLGKSAQTIKAAQALKVRTSVTLCPAIARFNWENEMRKFDPANQSPIHIITKKSQILPLIKELKHTSYERNKEENRISPHYGARVICSYDLARPLAKACADELFFFDLLVSDEAHFLKSIQAQRTLAVFGQDGLGHKADRIWLLSGTPAPNHPAELWPMLYTMKILRLKYEEFVERYCTYYKFQDRKIITGARADHVSELREFLKIFMLRRKKSEVLKELPDLIFANLALEPGEFELDTHQGFISYVFPGDNLSALHKRLERESQVLKSIMLEIAPTIESQANSLMPLLEGLAKSVATLRRYNSLKKINPIYQLVKQELEENQYKKVVIFGIHRELIGRLGDLMRKDFGARVIYGGLTPEKRERHIQAFQNDPSCKVIIANIHAAGTAINLTAAHQIIMAESAWTPQDNAQAIARCHRLGQKEKVMVRFVTLIDDPMDRKITDIVRRKTKYFLELFDGQQMHDTDTDFETNDSDNEIDKELGELLS